MCFRRYRRRPRPDRQHRRGTYLKTCSQIQFNGTTLAASCSLPEVITHNQIRPTINVTIVSGTSGMIRPPLLRRAARNVGRRKSYPAWELLRQLRVYGGLRSRSAGIMQRPWREPDADLAAVEMVAAWAASQISMGSWFVSISGGLLRRHRDLWRHNAVGAAAVERVLPFWGVDG